MVSMNWQNYFQQSVLYAIALTSIIALTILIERLYTLNRLKKDQKQFFDDYLLLLQSNKTEEIITRCQKEESALSKICQHASFFPRTSRKALEDYISLLVKVQMQSAEKLISIISLMAYLAPSLGLLGTVLGFIEIFENLEQRSIMDMGIGYIGQAMRYSLLTTACGLAVSIPATIAYNFLTAKVLDLGHTLEYYSNHLLNQLLNHATVVKNSKTKPDFDEAFAEL